MKTNKQKKYISIIESDGTNLYSTQYTYSPGILNGEIQYYWSNYQGKLFNGNTYTAERFFTTSLLPVSNNSEGGSVSYSNVTERRAGNGRTEYTFSNHDNRLDENSVSIDLQKSPYSPLSSRIMERGKLLGSKIYKEGAASPFRKDTFQYTILNNDPQYIRSVYLRRLALFDSYFINAVEGSAYKIYIYPYNVTQKTEYFYDNSSMLQNNRRKNTPNAYPYFLRMGTAVVGRSRTIIWDIPLAKVSFWSRCSGSLRERVLDDFLVRRWWYAPGIQRIRDTPYCWRGGLQVP